MVRVIGTDPGTSSLDLLLFDDGRVRDQRRFEPMELKANPEMLADAILGWTPIDLVAAPSGYGLPLVRGDRIDEDELDQMSLVRPDERGQDRGVIGFRSWVRAFLATGLPTVFLPGGYHLPTIPAHRKVNAVDLGTADKVAVAALALEHDARLVGGYDRSTFAVVEVGSAFTAALVVQGGRLVDASAGTRGPLGLRSGGVWDGEMACWRSPLSKQDLFRGGLDDLGPEGPAAFRESLRKAAAGLRAVTPFERIYLSGAGLDRDDVLGLALEALDCLGRVERLPSLPNAWVKHAAQGSALLADALAGGRHAALAGSLRLAAARGCVWDAVGRR
ncbi:hypothetical protein OJF2_60640 [Aquisphaera giovannonii]|uniref:Uncharacterized protein n=1 Tax=Aquisphaera giovannonii TaxID=406548 RepID=A0A5B9WAA0_9BACT|nr:DUF1464 family protein [Aquisphaera giovannonii]QEH37473.1 hypothetical protein OJF2_60640 [Aquisphaera giovannonii]